MVAPPYFIIIIIIIMKDIQELTTSDEVYNAVFKAYGMTPPDKLVFRVTPYRTEWSKSTPYVPSVGKETVNDPVSGNPLYIRNTYDPNNSKRLDNVKPRLVPKFTKASVAIDYEIDVNGSQMKVSVGVVERAVSNGKGVATTTRRVPGERRIIMNPDVVIQARSQRSVAIGLLLHPNCLQSPLNWKEDMRADNGIFTELLHGVPAIVRYECLTITEFQGRAKASGNEVKQADFLSLLADINKDAFVFSRFCQRLGVDCTGEGGLAMAYVSIVNNGLKDPKYITKAISAAIDPAMTAKAVADSCVANSVLKDTDAGWVYAFGANAPVGAGPGLSGLVEKLEKDSLLRAVLQEAARNRQRIAEVVEEEAEDVRKWLLMVENSIQLGYACTDGKLPEGAILCDPATSTWVNSKGDKIVYRGNGKSADMWEKAIKEHFRKKVRSLLSSKTHPDEIDNLIQSMLGYKTPRDV